MKTRATILFLLLTAVACDDDPHSPPSGTVGDYRLFDAFPEQVFTRPVDLQNAGDGSHRLFVVEQAGRVMVFNALAPTSAAKVFMDIRTRVVSGGELGLLGLAFHPDYESNGFFFVYYTTTVRNARTSRLSRFRVSAGDPNAGDPASERVLLEIGQPFGNHNGGGLTFAGDGMLYVSLGDGGSGGDPQSNAQDRTNLLGSILRLDVNQNVDVPPYYAIPADNPFAGNTAGYREEIYAYGLRNPWRISYDAVSDRIWVGDVGQASWEEVDVLVSGGNYGWDCREGMHDYVGPPDGPSPACATAGPFVEPVFEYARGGGSAVTGGYVYRGFRLPLHGMYVFGDYVQGRIWALQYNGTDVAVKELLDSSRFFSCFGVSEKKELYVVDTVAGEILGLVEADE